MRGAKLLSLEDYVRFFNKEERALTLDQLNQIVRINGFSKRGNFSKSSIVDLLSTVELTPPGRSTVVECLVRSSTCVELSLAEVMKDIASLGWQECPIVSILTVGNESAVKEIVPISFSCSSDRAKKKGGKGGESKSGAKRRRKSVAAITNLPLIVSVERTTGSPSGSQV